jgi:hypothetical protein
MNKKETIDYWKEFLDISDWDIKTKKINPKAVVYDNQCPDEDKYFVGIEANHKDKLGTIYHDRDLTERDIIHELLHVRHPEESESWVNEMEGNLYSSHKLDKSDWCHYSGMPSPKAYNKL